MDPLETARWSGHVSRCGRCAKYDRVMRRGLKLVRETLSIEPSPDFYPRLQQRLEREETPIGFERAAPAAGVMLSLVVASMIALIAWSPLLRPTLEPAPAGSPVAAGFAAGRGAGPRPDAAVPAWWSGPATVAGHMPRSLPGPYSPLLVTGPAFRPGDASFTLAPLVE